MGFKASMIIVNHPSPEISNEELLYKLGFANCAFDCDTTLEECMYPRDKSINIGYYNNCLIISDDYLLTTSLELSKTPQSLSEYEKILTGIFPGAEILTVACHSAVNYHLYSLAKDGQRIRFKRMSADDPLIEYGDRIKEEEQVYQYSKIIDGKILFRSTYRNDEVYDNTEDQMMEDFAFGVAKRHLGIKISTVEDEELMFETTFKKYKGCKLPKKEKQVDQQQADIEKHPKSHGFHSFLKKPDNKFLAGSSGFSSVNPEVQIKGIFNPYK